jgi:hypothetical protein
MILRVLIVVLAIADGVLHFILNFVLFRGNVFGPLPFGSPFGVALNHLFVLNLVGYLVLAAAFWFAPRFLDARSWLVDVALILFSLLTILGWVQIGMPNPRGLGYLSKALEVALIAALAVHLWSTRRSDRAQLSSVSSRR